MEENNNLTALVGLHNPGQAGLIQIFLEHAGYKPTFVSRPEDMIAHASKMEYSFYLMDLILAVQEAGM